MNRGAEAAVPNVCSEQASILHYICFVYVFLLSVAVDPACKQYGSVIVPLFRLTYCYTVRYLCALNINNLPLNIIVKYCYQS